MSINGDCPFCAGHSTEDEWDAWNGECQWCGQFDVEWEAKKTDKNDISDRLDDEDDDYGHDAFDYDEEDEG